MTSQLLHSVHLSVKASIPKIFFATHVIIFSEQWICTSRSLCTSVFLRSLPFNLYVIPEFELIFALAWIKFYAPVLPNFPADLCPTVSKDNLPPLLSTTPLIFMSTVSFQIRPLTFSSKLFIYSRRSKGSSTDLEIQHLSQFSSQKNTQPPPKSYYFGVKHY